METATVARPAPHPPARTRVAGALRGRLTLVAVSGLSAYAVVRVIVQLTQPTRMSSVGTDLIAVTGWWSVALWAAGAVLAGLLGRTTRGLVVAGGFVVAALMAVSAGLLLLDAVGGLLPGLGIQFFPLGALSRAGAAGSALLLATAAATALRRGRAVCAECGRPIPLLPPLAAVPAWARWGAAAVVAGCAVRIAAQAAVGFTESPLPTGPAVYAFEAGFLLAGTLLPLALVSRFGRIWPRWVPLVAGRRVPRMLVLAPAAAIAAGMNVYFDLMLALMVWDRLHGRNPFPPSGGLDLPESFFWVSVPAYAVWAIGLAVATVGYYRVTRNGCGSERG